jgi:ATP-dependent helicase/nuclease subunit A
VARLVRAACDSEPVRRAATARHWREVPLGAPFGGVLLEGFVDLLYELPDGRLVIVDYKTDSVSWRPRWTAGWSATGSRAAPMASWWPR